MNVYRTVLVSFLALLTIGAFVRFVPQFAGELGIGPPELASADTAWWDASWNARRRISFKTSTMTESYTDFPLLVLLNSSRVDYAKTQDSGQDIRFVNESGTQLAHEIEKWNESGTSTLWVQVPLVTTSSPNDHIWMYYGNSGASDGQNKASVWDQGYALVMHLSETSGTHFDSTTSTNDSIAIDVQQQGVATGTLAGADRFSRASTDNIDVADDNTLDMDFASGGYFSAEAWFRYDSDPGHLEEFIVNKKTGSAGWQVHLAPDNTLAFWMSDGPVDIDANGTTPVATGTWHYVAARYDGGTNVARLYLDGVQDAIDSDDLTSIANGNPFVIGEEGDDGDSVPRGFNFNGVIDEVRFARTYWSQNWYLAQYQSLSDGFTSSTPEETNGILQQTHYRWRNDDADEAGASFAANEDTVLTGVARYATYRFRVGISNEGTATSGAAQYRLEYATSPSSTWTTVGGPASTTTAWVMWNSTNLTDAASTTNVTSGLTDENTTFRAGQAKDTSAQTAGLAIAATEFTELEYAVRATSSAVTGQTYYFRVTDAGSALAAYNNYGMAKVASGAASGTVVSSVIDSGRVNGCALNSILWQGTKPAGTAVKFQLGMANASSGPWSYLGPNCTTDASDVYAPTPGSSTLLTASCMNGYRYFRYEVILESDSGGTATPRVDDVIINWSP
jgi:hypothetical protein